MEGTALVAARYVLAWQPYRAAHVYPDRWDRRTPTTRNVQSDATHACISSNVPECSVCFGAFTLGHHLHVPTDWMGMF